MGARAERVVATVLRVGRSCYGDARVTSAVNDECGNTVVRLRGAGSGPCSTAVLVDAVRRHWPLAEARVVKSPLDGRSEALITMPSLAAEYEECVRRVRRDPNARRLVGGATLLTLCGLVMHAYAYAWLA